ncbi:MAG: PaaI family thioesterase [Acetobacteraceae bacterium]|nr:PaaI family thioesterase [Acetobacteraceae bacterium]MSP29669.1 PaaI family thioesterase [Acetobacteraceae bacterium]
MDLKTRIQAKLPPFPQHLGIQITEATHDRVCAEVTVRPDLSIETNTLHGGAIMAIADTLGAVATIVNLQKGQWTATLESKTNFLGAAPTGSRILFECLPLHKGRRTMIWQTNMRNEQGKLLAQVTQTQMVLGEPAKPPA